MKEYQNKEFCKDAMCSIQYLIDNGNEELKEDSKNYCENECPLYRFQQWLKENEYKIIKEELNDN